MAEPVSPGEPLVSVVIPARDAAATLPSTLRAIAAQRTSVAFEVVVVDDGSTDATTRIAAASPLGVHLVRGPGEGPAKARNRGAAAARGRILAFTDADCFPEPDWLEAGVACLRAADLVQGKVTPPEGARAGPYDRSIAVVSEYGLYETANLFVRRALFDRLGGFESILQPRSGKELGEDVWFGWRARRAGAATAFCEQAVVRHAVFARRPIGYVAEQARARFFPELARLVPELRDEFFHRRVFLSRRTARFDLAVGGVAVALLWRRPAALALVVPYARLAAADAGRWPGHSPLAVGLVSLTADAVTLVALLGGSVRSRTLVC